MSLVLDLLIAALAIVGALGFLVSALALLRVRDALSMVNSLGPATGVGVPLLLAAALLHQGRTEGWDIGSVVEVVLAVLAALVVSSIASNALGRAAYRSGAPLDPKTDPNELAGR